MLIFEIMRVYHNDNPEDLYQIGWGFRSKSDYLIYVNPDTMKGYVFKFKLLRPRVQELIGMNANRLKKTGNFTNLFVSAQDESKTHINVFVPMEDLKGLYRVIDLK